MNATEFEALVGRPPQEDDLERANCTLAGSSGHHQCGVCPGCQHPRFLCFCSRREGLYGKDVLVIN